MPPPAPDVLTPADLEARLRAVLPAARVVRERHVRKVLHRLAQDGDPVTLNPEPPLWVRCDRLRRVWGLPDTVTAGPDETVVLLTGPTDRFPRDRPPAEVLREYWRLLLRAAVADHLAAATASRLADLGPGAEAEVRFVLETDHHVPYDADPVAAYRAFAAVFIDLWKFEPHDLRWMFPTLAGRGDGVAALLARDVPIENLCLATRPAGAADPDPGSDLAEVSRFETVEAVEPALTGSVAGRLAEAARVADLGNFARAAILRADAARTLGGREGEKVAAFARAAVRDGLVKRIGAAAGWDAGTRDAWARALLPLLDPAAEGAWPRAARCLYDLQRIAVDLGGELSAVDPVEWAWSLGRRPVCRPLTRARDVILLRHLGSALRHLHATPLRDRDRDRLDALFAAETHAAEGRVRRDLGPVIRRVLEQVGLCPTNVPERLAKDKLVAELLDRICERGFLRLADLRDAVARNRLKMPDLRGPGEFVRGDALLQADEKLAVELDGVYRRGEVYLRWIQRGTAAAFGTRVGRWVSKYLALPFGGALVTVEGTRYLAHEVGHVVSFLRHLLPRAPGEEPLLSDEAAQVVIDAGRAAGKGKHESLFTLQTMESTLVLGLLFLLLLHWPAFRVAFFGWAAAGLRLLRTVLVSLPLRAWRSPPVRALRDNPATRLVVWHFGSATLVALGLAAALTLLGAGPERIGRWAGYAFLFTALAAHTPVGRKVEDGVAEGLEDAWRRVRGELIPGLLGWILWFFRELAGLIERGLYSVDEWFRFRPGQTRGSLVLKAALAVLWFPIAYLVRFAFNLLLEPQINPVKHFPVVTVSHKLLLPMIPSVAQLTGLAEGTVAVLIAGVPGIFGFIVWELKENWRLYAASRPERLVPVVLGHHGETARGLLRPGFHSGTIPRAYRKLRAAVRQAAATGQPVPVGKQTHELAELAAAVEHFAGRELVPLLRSAAAWDGLSPRVGRVTVAVQTVEVELAVPELGGPGPRLAFDHAGGEIVARLAEPGWLPTLDPARAVVLSAALAGFCRMAAATLPSAVGASPLGDDPTWADWVAFWDAAAKKDLPSTFTSTAP